MIPANALVASLQNYIRTADIPLVQVVDALQEIQQLFTIGEQVRAQVTGQLPSGRYSVLVKDQLLDLNLPRNTEEGEQLDMRVLANSPRLTFLLERQPGNVPLPQPQQAPPDTSSSVDLSETARFLGNLLAESAGEEAPVQTRTQVLTQPLMATLAAAPDTVKLADALKQALSESGLFYESHLAQWSNGERTLQQLLTEPQAKAFELLRQQIEQQRPATAAEPGKNARPAVEARASDVMLPADKDRQVSERASQALGAGLLDGNTQELDNMPATARQLVQQQLQVLDQRQVVWQGQAWPGQPLRWEIEEDGQGRSGEEADRPKVWRTRLHLTLPHLGSVEALISLMDGSRLEVGFRVKQSDTAAKIRDAQPRLQAQLEAAGLDLRANQVTLVTEKEDLG
ncbi:flagellar hook-length control protein FliK [Chitinimonas sp.]|uniref:flagellar hook-length control protein FliK n=1 Tax=Chitinimonas sp. TaxID=1934313 RepID=UPI002F91EF1A